ncbi:putative RNA-directed DNA polymerase, eukaryota, reverse transcriptase zinc-binding domain protein, partial [Tanacetum coccineum]
TYLSFIQSYVGSIILFGDLNEVRCEAERSGYSFSSRDAEIFNSFIHDVGLINLPLGGRMFTWMNKTGTKLSKLDRFLISNNVLLAYPNMQVTVLDKIWSDHNPILLHCKKFDFGPIPFKPFHSWFSRQDFDGTVKAAWNDALNTDVGPNLALHEKSKSLKSQLKLWFSRTRASEEKTLRVNTWYELDNLEKLESMDLLQKARVRWDVEGDENSKFFHGIINSRRNTQRIQGILHEGVWISDPNAIKYAFLNFYKEKFACHDSLVSFPPLMAANRLSDSDRVYLDDVVSLEEIKHAVWDCGSQKAPGLDGFSFMFINKYWDLLHLDIQNFVVSFFSSGKFPLRVNSSFFTLIPKVANPLYIKDYKPISLIGFQYKIVTKILANRLVKVIDSIISQEQSDFISGRHILDGPLILSEVIDWYKKRNKKMLLFKVDFEKAFESVSWRFWDHVMESLGFSSVWRSWIKAGFMLSRASILCGSPGVRLSYLFYADDVIILSEWSQNDMDNIILESMAIGTGCSPSFLHFSYLGLPIGFNMGRISSWKVLVDRFKARLSGWKANMFSSSGRLTLIKSMLGSLGIYYLSNFKAPEGVIKELESLRASFFWGASVLKLIHGDEVGLDLKGCQTNGLWARIVGSIYHLHSSGCIPLSSFRFNVGDGSLIRFWKDTWLGDVRLCARYNRLYHLENNLNCLIGDRIVIGSWSRDWRRPVNGGRVLADLKKFLVDISLLNIEDGSDAVVFSLSSDGNFTVSIARIHIDDCTLPSTLPCTRWCKSLPRKVNIFMGRLFLDKLPHRLNLSSRGLDIHSIICQSCDEKVESNSHAFFLCTNASDIWSMIRAWSELKFPILSSFDDWDFWFSSWRASKDARD